MARAKRLCKLWNMRQFQALSSLVKLEVEFGYLASANAMAC